MMKSKLVALRNRPPVGSTITIQVEENDKGYNGLAFNAIDDSGKQFAFVYQAAQFAEPGFLGITDVIDTLGTEEVIGKSWDATIDNYSKASSGRYVAEITINIPEMNKKKGTVKKMASATTKKKTTMKSSEKYTVIGIGGRNDLDAKGKELRYAERVLEAGGKQPPLDVVLEQTAEGKIAVKVPEAIDDKKGTFKDVIIAYLKDNEKATISEADIWKMVSHRPYTARIVGQSQLIHLIIEVDVLPNEEKTKLVESLSTVGLTQEVVEKKERYLTSNGFSEDDLIMFWKVYGLIHKDYPVYNPDDDRYTYISSGGKQSEVKLLLQSFYKSVGTIIVGPPAAGKDEAINTLARLLNIRVVRQVADANMDADVLIGMQGITNDNGVGVTQFQPSLLMDTLDQPTGTDKPLTLYVMDEANMANPDQFVVLNELLNISWPLDVLTGKVKSEGQLVSFTRGGDRMVCPWFRMFLTMNVDLEGCKAFNQATWSRMDTIVFHQNISMKDILLREFPTLPNKDAVMADRLWNAIKTEAKNSGEEEVNEVGPRNFKSAARDVLLFGSSMQDALRNWVITKIQVPDTRQAMEKILASYS